MPKSPASPPFSTDRLAVPVDELPAYENELKADRYLVIVHGDSQSVERAHAILESAGPVRVNSYAA